MSGSPAPKPRRALRRTLGAIAIVLLLLIIVVATSPWWFDARRVASLAMDQADAATGLDWSFDGEPELRWRPSPWLALPGLRAVDAQARAVLAAERAEVALPWSTLRGEALRIDALRLDSPDIDLDAALEWWSAQPPDEDAELPILNGLSITNGALRWSGGRIEAIDATLPRFAIGEPFALVLAATVVPANGTNVDATDAPRPFDVRLNLKATPRAAPLRLDDMDVDLAGSGPMPTMRASGSVTFAPWNVHARGTLAAWPDAWPVLPAPLSASASPIAFELSQSGESALDAPLRLDLRRDEFGVDAELVPRDMLAWLDAETAASAAVLPPLTGSAKLPEVGIDGIMLEGVSVEIVEEEAPAQVGAEASPAAASPTQAHDG